MKKQNIYNVLAFFAIGLISHAGIWLYKIASTDCNSAGLFHYTPDWEVTLGRWLIPVVDGIRYYLSVPFFVGPLAVLLFAIGTTLVLNILEIESDIFRYVIGAFLMVTPCVGNTLMFYYCADSYALSMIFACLFVMFMKKEFSIKNFLIAVVLLIMSLGLYQAYLGVAAVLCAGVLIVEILDGKATELEIVKKAIYMATSALVSLLLYYGISRIIVNTRDLSLAGYGGADNVSKTSLLDVKIAVALAYQKFVYLFWGLSQSKYHSFYRIHIYSGLVSGIFACVFITIIITKKIYVSTFKTVALAVLTLLMPLLCGSIMLIVKGHDIHILMCQSYFVIIAFIAAVVLRTRTTMGNIAIINGVSLGTLILIALMGFELTAINNSTYEYNHIVRNNMVSTLNRVLTQAECMEGYTEETEFAFAGRPANGYPVDSYLEKMSFLETSTLYSNEYRFNIAVMDNILKEDIGCAVKICDEDTFKQLVSSEEFKNMPKYPDNGSLKLVDDVILVKFSDEVLIP